jgi:hypothetical protein
MVLALLSTSLAVAAEPPAGAGKAFNPDISANFLGLWQHGTGLSNDRGAPPANGFSLQEAELQFTADVDPYLRASALFSVAQEPTGTPGELEWGIDPEEVYLETISLPVVTLKVGKFKLALGKHNQLHTHAFPFIDAPLIHQALLGDEGVNEVGLSAAALIPASWYSELIVQGFSPTNDTLFNDTASGTPTRSGDVGALVRWKNLLDLSDDLTAELGLGGLEGKNGLRETASVLAGDLTFKWRPSEGGKYQALIWSTEYLRGRHPISLLDPATGTSTINRLGGIASWVQYQFAERWWVQARFERLGLPHAEGVPSRTRQSALFGFFPSEFTGLRLQYDHENRGPRGKADHTVAFQYNISIGAHPAHAY